MKVFGQKYCYEQVFVTQFYNTCFRGYCETLGYIKLCIVEFNIAEKYYSIILRPHRHGL